MAARHLTAAEAATRLGIDTSRVRRLAGAGRMPGAHRRQGEWRIPDPPMITPGARGPKRR